MQLNWINTAAGFGVGLLVGLTGVGGGSLMTPIMILLFGIAPSTAVGTDLWFAAITKIVGGWAHDRKGTIDWQILRRMFLGSLPAAVLTLIWLYSSGHGQSHNQLMFKTLGFTLILSSFAAVFRKRFHAFGARMRGREAHRVQVSAAGAHRACGRRFWDSWSPSRRSARGRSAR